MSRNNLRLFLAEMRPFSVAVSWMLKHKNIVDIPHNNIVIAYPVDSGSRIFTRRTVFWSPQFQAKVEILP